MHEKEYDIAVRFNGLVILFERIVYYSNINSIGGTTMIKDARLVFKSEISSFFECNRSFR